MDIHPQILTFAGSLIAIFALAGLAVLLRLGGTRKLTNTEEARLAAGEVLDGYEPSRIALDKDGAGAVMIDEAGKIMVIKTHGNQFAGRILTASASARTAGDTVTINSGESRYGNVTLRILDATSWGDAINRLSETSNA